MTPSGIEVLIHCHVSPTPHPRREAPAVAEELHSLEINGLIERVGSAPDLYTTTERGAKHISQLCGTGWPRAAWIDDNGRLID